MNRIKFVGKPRKIAGLTIYTEKEWLDRYLEKTHGKQGFELYEAPPEFLPKQSPLFIFEKSIGLKALARFDGCVKINGWIGNDVYKQKAAENIAKKLLQFYKENGISHTFNGEEEAIKFCNKHEGIRGAIIFDELTEIQYRRSKQQISFREVKKLLNGKQPYAQGFPYRYLSKGDVCLLLKEIEKRASNFDRIAKLIKKKRLRCQQTNLFS